MSPPPLQPRVVMGLGLFLKKDPAEATELELEWMRAGVRWLREVGGEPGLAAQLEAKLPGAAGRARATRRYSKSK